MADHYTGEGFIYLIGETGPYKIGLSEAPEKRLELFKKQAFLVWEFGVNPMALSIIHTIRTNNMRRAEQALHALYADKKARTDRTCEWFRLNTSDLDLFCSLRVVNVLDLPLQQRKGARGRMVFAR